MKSRDAAEDAVVARPAVDEGSTRRHLLQLLLSQGPLTAAVLADQLEISSTAVRRHLSSLTDDGLIEAHDPDVIAADAPRGRGRPASVFALTRAGREAFTGDYDALAISAIGELLEAVGPEAVNRIAEKRLAQVATEFHDLRAADPTITAPEALAQALNSRGYYASQIGDGDGVELFQNHCPVAGVAAEYPELCSAEAEVLGKLLGTEVERRTTIAQGGPRCQLHVFTPVVPVAVDETLKHNSSAQTDAESDAASSTDDAARSSHNRKVGA